MFYRTGIQGCNGHCARCLEPHAGEVKQGSTLREWGGLYLFKVQCGKSQRRVDFRSSEISRSDRPLAGEVPLILFERPLSLTRVMEHLDLQ